MNGLAKTLLAFLVCAGTALAGGKPTVKAVFASGDVPLNTDASTAFWRSAGIASLEKDTQGKDVPNFHGEVRMRWTRDNLYFLFICPYDELYLKPAPTTRETNELWNWDVAEVFISANFATSNSTRNSKSHLKASGSTWISIYTSRIMRRDGLGTPGLKRPRASIVSRIAGIPR